MLNKVLVAVSLVAGIAFLALGQGWLSNAHAGGGPLAYISNTSSDDVWVVDLDSASVVAVVPVGDDPRGIDITPDNSRVYVANRFDNTISAIDTSSNTVAQTIDLDASALVSATEPYDVVVSPDGGHLYVAMKNGGSENGDGTVVVVELPAGNVIAEEVLDSSASPEGIVVTPDGQKVYVAGRGDMYVVDVSNPVAPNFTGTAGSAERELVVSPDGAFVFAEDNAVDTSDDSVSSLNDALGERGVAISPDGQTIFTTDEDTYVEVYSVDAGPPPDTTFLQTIDDTDESESYGIDLTDEGDRGMVSYRGSNTVRIFDTATLSFTGSAIPMEFDPGTGMIFGSEPKQLVITHSPAPPTADLSVTKTAADADGEDLIYTITVTNNGPDTATGVQVVDPLPDGVDLVSATPSQGTCAEAAATVTCDIGTLDNGASATIEILVTPTVEGVLSNTATVTGSEEDPDSSNDSAVADVNVGPGGTVTPLTPTTVALPETGGAGAATDASSWWVMIAGVAFAAAAAACAMTALQRRR
ncbi:MAG: beta-propeller fold lactonase family protein [Dehalococcoidia bacterium]